ncbi:MAG: NUDIX hydrolase [Lentisphaerae bacterium]|nr:NUDIX hydrolase [Lentisphaerota bacterium]
MKETILSTTRAYDGRLLKVDVLDVALASGQRSTREVVQHPGAAVILAQLGDGRFVFVRQYRAAIGRETLEVVAGTLHPGEDPVACAHRELREESGYTARDLERLGTVLPAPGYTTERLHTFFARLNPTQQALATDIDEHVQVEYLTAAQIDAHIADGKIEDAKTLAAWMLYLARQHRDRRLVPGS